MLPGWTSKLTSWSARTPPNDSVTPATASAGAGSDTTERGRTFLHESGDALAEVFGRGGVEEGGALGVELGVEVAAMAVAHQPLDRGKRPGRSIGQTLGERVHLGVEPVGRHHPIDQAERHGLGRRHGVGEHRHLDRPAPADQARQEEGGRSVGWRADPGKGKGEPGILGGEREIAGEREADPSAGDRALEPRDHRAMQPDDQADGGMGGGDHPVGNLAGARRVGGKASDIAPGHEGAAVSAQDDGANVGVTVDRDESLVQRFGAGLIDRVQNLGPVQQDRCDRALPFDNDGVGHVVFLPGGAGLIGSRHLWWGAVSHAPSLVFDLSDQNPIIGIRPTECFSDRGSDSTLRTFDELYRIAADRKGGAAALETMIPTPLSPEAVAAIPSDRWLAEVTRGVFQTGLNRQVIEAKWPAFEAAFDGFDVARCAMMHDEDVDRLLADPGIIRHGPKLRSVIENAQFLRALDAEHGSAARLFATWPNTDFAGLLELMKTRGARLGGATGQRVLRALGRDGYVLAKDVVARLVAEGVIDRAPTGKGALAAVQDAFNAWMAQSGRGLTAISRVLALSIDA